MAGREDDYDAACIEVLRGLENVRKRPQWHIQAEDDGGTPESIPEGLMDIEAIVAFVGCSRAMALHHIERGFLAWGYNNEGPLLTREAAEALKLRHEQILDFRREISAATEEETAIIMAATASPNAP